MQLRLYDAHNHFHDERLRPHRASIIASLAGEGITRMVVNGSCEEDWPEVLALSQQHPQIIPSFGYHPWYVKERTDSWEKNLIQHLDQVPAGIGEIGLDRWIKDHDLDDQAEVFVRQLRLAAERNLPVSIHCLQAWGKLLELLRVEPRPACGFLLHSFGGPAEMVAPLAKLGAYFSFPGYFMHERKQRQRETFKLVPPDRLLIETDAPDQLLPAEYNHHPLLDSASGKPINHPANLGSVYEFVANMLNEPLEILTQRVEGNFLRLFGKFSGRVSPTPACDLHDRSIQPK
ncbi:MAG: TatD family hydrolase [Verrucomicrobia bacterium]|nr:TatD family hydrolase [Verrucomicrobiota bacterium]